MKKSIIKNLLLILRQQRMGNEITKKEIIQSIADHSI